MKLSTKLIAIDIDGTLLTDNQILLPETIKSLQLAQKNNIKIVITTGRPFVSIIPILNQLNLNHKSDQYVINYNGGLIRNTNTQIYYNQKLTIVDFNLLDSISRKSNITMIAQTDNQILTTRHHLNTFVSFESYKNKLPIQIQNVKNKIDLSTNIYKILFLEDKKKIDQFTYQIPSNFFDKYNIIRTENYSLDVLPKNISKGSALKKLADMLNIIPNNIIAIGNSDNDISMIKYAGTGVAMKNSTPSLLKFADYVTPFSNNENGVGKYIKKLFK